MARVNRQFVLIIAAVVAASAIGFIAGVYWDGHASPSPPAPKAAPKVLVAETVSMPAASYTRAQQGVGTAYWYSAYVGLPLTFAYNAPFPVDACLIDLPAGDPGGGHFYDSCSSHPGATIQTNRSAGVMSFIVPSQRDNGFDFDVLSPRGKGCNVTFAWWINSTSGIVARWPLDNFSIPSAQLIGEAHVGRSISLPAGYDNVSVQGRSTSPIELAVDGEFAAGHFMSWNWTVSYRGPRSLQVDLLSRSFDAFDLSLAVIVFNS